LLALIDAFRMIEAPSGSSGSAAATTEAFAQFQPAPYQVFYDPVVRIFF
jgi:hypothetical protein